MYIFATALSSLAIALTLLNLLILFAVVRRLRGLGERSRGSVANGLPEIGTVIGEYETTLLTGATLTQRDLIDGTTLVAFFSPGCAPCKETIARFASESDKLPDHTYAFIVGSDDDLEARQYAGELASVARVGYVTPDSQVLTAFGGVSAFPTLQRIEAGAVAAAGHQLDDVVVTPALIA